jgi:hypothetical protein
MKELEWIGVDLDKTLAYYDGWVAENHIGEPIVPMVNRVKQWLSEGKRVKIFTARVSYRDDRHVNIPETRRCIEEWCEKHIGQRLEVTNVKDSYMVELWDDRAVSVEPNTGASIRVLGGSGA